MRQLGRLNGAKSVFERGMHVNPLNTNFLLNAGQVYQDLTHPLTNPQKKCYCFFVLKRLTANYLLPPQRRAGVPRPVSTAN